MLLLAVALAATPVTAWEYRWADETQWSPLTLPAHPPRSGQHLAWERAQLPQGDWRSPALKLDGVIGHFELYVDGVRTLTWPEGGLEAKGMHGQPWFLVDLPPGAQAVELKVLSHYPLIGVQRTPSIGERSELLEGVVRRDAVDLAVGFTLLLMSALALLVFAPRRLGLALYCASGGLYTLYYTHLKQLVVPLTPAVWFWLWLLALATLFPSALSFIRDALVQPPRWASRVLQLNIVAGALFVGGCLVAWVGMELWGLAAHRFASTFLFWGGTALRLVLVVSWVATAAHLVRAASTRHPDRFTARLLLVGYAGPTVAMMLRVLSSFGLGLSIPNVFIGPGLLVLSLALAAIAHRAWVQARAEVALRVREKEEMLRDLHDGIGGVTTHIRLLAELGRNDAQKAMEALSAIAELSTEGLAELRAFTQTLDESEAAVTWPVLFSELRRFGGQHIESHGKTFNLTASTDDEGRPSGSLCLAVLRIFREALTNVVKHAGATRVDVAVRVEKGQLSIEMRDDGRGGGGGGGLDTGRGIANMKARAQQLGGALSVSSDSGTRLRLELPIPQNSPAVGVRSPN